MNIVSYLILLTVLLVVLCVIGILAVTLRSCFPLWCCTKNTEDQEGHTEQPSGRRNLAFDDQEEIRSVRPRPYSNMEQLESPPPYEEAIRQELFRFQLLPAPNHESEAENNNNLETSNPSTNSASNSTSPPASSPQNSPTASPRSRISRPRSSTSGSSGSSSPLSTINEEEEEWPVRVVIDCIGVQTARLMDNCDTTVHLSNGNALSTNSKCECRIINVWSCIGDLIARELGNCDTTDYLTNGNASSTKSDQNVDSRTLVVIVHVCLNCCPNGQLPTVLQLSNLRNKR